LLRERGEGFFLLSFGVDDLEDAATRARDAGARFALEQARTGLAGWRVMDFDVAETWGDTLQLTEEQHGS
jgi:predicted enzyme related to lactoylglutathione lyase